jgi:hypothetical protein
MWRLCAVFDYLDVISTLVLLAGTKDCTVLSSLDRFFMAIAHNYRFSTHILRDSLKS